MWAQWGGKKRWNAREARTLVAISAAAAQSTKATESSVDSAGQTEGDVGKDSSFRVSLTRKTTPSTGQTVLSRAEGRGLSRWACWVWGAGCTPERVSGLFARVPRLDSYVPVMLGRCSLFLACAVGVRLSCLSLALPTFIFIFSLGQASSVTKSEDQPLCDPMDYSMAAFCPSLSSGVCSNSSPLSWWCYLTISPSAAPIFFCLQSFPASGSFPQVARVLELQLWHQSFQWIKSDLVMYNWHTVKSIISRLCYEYQQKHNVIEGLPWWFRD